MCCYLKDVKVEEVKTVGFDILKLKLMLLNIKLFKMPIAIKIVSEFENVLNANGETLKDNINLNVYIA